MISEGSDPRESALWGCFGLTFIVVTILGVAFDVVVRMVL